MNPSKLMGKSCWGSLAHPNLVSVSIACLANGVIRAREETAPNLKPRACVVDRFPRVNFLNISEWYPSPARWVNETETTR